MKVISGSPVILLSCFEFWHWECKLFSTGNFEEKYATLSTILTNSARMSFDPLIFDTAPFLKSCTHS